jgi:hypothetical protein
MSSTCRSLPAVTPFGPTLPPPHFATSSPHLRCTLHVLYFNVTHFKISNRHLLSLLIYIIAFILRLRHIFCFEADSALMININIDMRISFILAIDLERKRFQARMKLLANTSPIIIASTRHHLTPQLFIYDAI